MYELRSLTQVRPPFPNRLALHPCAPNFTTCWRVHFVCVGLHCGQTHCSTTPFQRTRSTPHLAPPQLDLSGCGLSGLPESLGAATQLQQLALSSNDLQQLPACLARLTRLRNLAIDYNSLCSLPVWLSCLTQLTSLDAAGNELTDLPPQMAPALGGLRLLTLGSNALQTLPACVMQLSGLQVRGRMGAVRVEGTGESGAPIPLSPQSQHHTLSVMCIRTHRNWTYPATSCQTSPSPYSAQASSIRLALRGLRRQCRRCRASTSCPSPETA